MCLPGKQCPMGSGVCRLPLDSVTCMSFLDVDVGVADTVIISRSQGKMA